MTAPTSRRGRLGRWALNGVAVLALVYLFVPIAWIVIFSFNQPNGRYNIVWQRFTLDNWADPFANEDLTSSFTTSLKIAAISTLIATVLGSMIALAVGVMRSFVLPPRPTPVVTPSA